MTDDFVQRLLNALKSKDALVWLRGGSDRDLRSIAEQESNGKSIELIELIYDIGAVEVWAVDIEVFPGGQCTDKLVIRLPDDVRHRKRIFEWAGSISIGQGFAAEPDSGQQYILVMLN